MEDPYEEMDKLLRSWNLPQLCEVFREQEITLDALEALTDLDITQLIPKVGPRALFRKHLNKWLQTPLRIQRNQSMQDEITKEEFQIEHSSQVETVEYLENNDEQIYFPVKIITDEDEISPEVLVENFNEDSICKETYKLEAIDIDTISDENENVETKPKNLKRKSETPCQKLLDNFKSSVKKPKQLKTHKEISEINSSNNLEENETENQEVFIEKDTKCYNLRKSKTNISADSKLTNLKQSQNMETSSFLNVKEILSKTEDGRLILEKYESNPKIDKQTRLFICDLIVSHVFAKNLAMDRNKFRDIASQIVAIFPTENIKTWFSPQFGNSRNSGGSLYYKYYGVYRKMRKTGFYEHYIEGINQQLIEGDNYPVPLEDIEDEPDKLAFRRAIPKYERLRRSCDFKRINVKALLESSYEGRGLTATYEKHKTFDSSTRNLLCKLITMEAFNKKIKMQPRDFYDISCQIVELFPNETVDMYFLPRGQTPPKGCLYHKYLYIKRKFRKMDIRNNSA